MKKKILFFCYGVVLVALFFYSFTQVDLSLTFSRIPMIRSVVDSFKYIGYFQRPISTDIYVAILSLLFIFYWIFLFLVYKGRLAKQTIWKLIFATCIILLFSYNAFSYDLFNYIFDAKIITYYHQNPYMHKALDFPGDPMLSFMHWTQRTYPYGPVWLVITVPLSFIGFQFFIPTFFFFKLLMSASFVGSVYYIGKILQKINPKKEVLGLVFFGLQPLVIIESLVSAHIDIVMLFFALFASYLLIEKKYLHSSLALLFSIGIKFATGFLLPVFALVFWYHKQKKSPQWRIVFLLATVLMSATTIIASVRTNFQPWYLIGPLAFAVFVGDWIYIIVVSSIISLFAMFTYVPFLYLGNWNPPVPSLLITTYSISYLFSIIAVAILLIKSKVSKK